MKMIYVARIAGLLMVIAATAVKAGVVEDVAPNKLMAYLETHDDVVLQFTSTDRECGYCTGADKAFERFAEKNAGRMSFVRVQWSPWQKTPEVLHGQFRIIAMPAQICIRNGKKVRAYPGIMLDKDKAALERFEKTCFSDGV